MQRHALLLVGIIVPILFILSLWKFPAWQVAGAATLTEKERLELIDKARSTFAQILAGVGIAVGLYFTWRRVAAAERTVQVAEEGQITERFTRAIDQLGATDEHGYKRLEIRLGGIYALERIARDSEKDHWPIMEVLTAYVREHAPWKGSSQPLQDPPEDLEAPSSEEDTSQQGGSQLEPAWAFEQKVTVLNWGDISQLEPRPDTDIQAILTVIGRRTRWYEESEDQGLDLNGTDIHGASLVGAHLQGTHLIGAHLERVNLTYAHLDKAILIRAHLQGAILFGAHLKHALLGEAHLQRANLLEAKLDGAILFRAHLEQADLRGAHLERANLGGAHLDGASLLEAKLDGASLFRAHLNRASLGGAHLERADLREAHLDGASLLEAYLQEAFLVCAHLDGADLDGANLTGTHLEGADLRYTHGLTREQLASAYADENTLLPDYLISSQAADGEDA